MTITMQELPEDLRDAFAAEAYIQKAAGAQSNQQLNNAQQQAADLRSIKQTGIAPIFRDGV